MSDTYSFSKVIRASEVTSKPENFHITAKPEDLNAIKDRLLIVDIESLEATASVSAVKNSKGIEISGEIKSRLTQECVATGDPVQETVDSPFSLLLLPANEVEVLDAEEAYMDPDAPEYDVLEGDDVDLGEVIVQTLAVTMEPYPRAEGVEISAADIAGLSVNEEAEGKPNPFAALKNLHNKT
ncbi:metal-binding protein [Kordiimonas sediminis]|uniref:Metal-binding protein n=1 Tax=Kordiimonas sediminis TaxID=1735581 RepID=A0A919AWW5_9PROT|nr:DUF177 domain-containing protein [Kordiimonas sediminis]GHF29050.1 metal-binding protein [Kordiimonas sediminis]